MVWLNRKNTLRLQPVNNKMMSGINYLDIQEDDQKFIRREFNNNRICYGFNKKTKKHEAWYRPARSAPYKITTAIGPSHAVYLLRQRVRNDQRRAKDILAEIDAHNDRLLDSKRADAVAEARSDLRRIASGRVMFMPPRRTG